MSIFGACFQSQRIKSLRPDNGESSRPRCETAPPPEHTTLFHKSESTKNLHARGRSQSAPNNSASKPIPIPGAENRIAKEKKVQAFRKKYLTKLGIQKGDSERIGQYISISVSDKIGKFGEVIHEEDESDAIKLTRSVSSEGLFHFELEGADELTQEEATTIQSPVEDLEAELDQFNLFMQQLSNK